MSGNVIRQVTVVNF